MIDALAKAGEVFEHLLENVRPALMEKRKYKNVHQVPRMEKIVLNMGVSASLEKGAVEDATRDMTLITGRKPIINKSRHSIANFKLREGQNIGCRVTLRREVMYEFFDRLVAAVENGPLCATQFHPEKSGDAGAALLHNWVGSL